MTQLKIKYKSETAEFINSAKLPEHYSYQIASELLETDVTFPLMWYFSNLIDSNGTFTVSRLTQLHIYSTILLIECNKKFVITYKLILMI